jgi:hypothetical protein
MPNLVENPFPIITDIDGDPLEDGYVFIGVAGLNPISNPLQAYWDSALTVPALNIRTKGGYPDNNGSPGRLYTDSNYSITVQDKRGATVYTLLDSIDYFNAPAGNVLQKVNTIADLRLIIPTTQDYQVYVGGYWNTGDVSNIPVFYWNGGSTEDDIGLNVIRPSGISALNPGRFIWDLTGPVNVKWGGAKGDGVTDDWTIIQGIMDYIWENGGGTIEAPKPDVSYLHSRPFVGRENVTFKVTNESGTLFIMDSTVYNADTVNNYWARSSWAGSGITVGRFQVNAAKYTVASISSGDTSIATSTAGDAGNFSIDDVINIISDAQVTVGGTEFYHYQDWNIVTSVSAGTGEIGLKYPIAEDWTGLKVMNATTNGGATETSGGGYTPTEGGTCNNFKLIGGIWQADNAFFGTHLTGVNNEWSPYAIRAQRGLAYTSGASRSLFTVEEEVVVEHSLDLAVGSHDNEVRKTMVTVTATTDLNQVVNFAENARENYVWIGKLNIGGSANNFSRGCSVQHLRNRDNLR